MQLLDPILSQTAELFCHTRDELTGRSRKRSIVLARQAAMWAIRRRYPSLSLATIGTALGGRHYSTVMHALAVVEARAEYDAGYRGQLQQLLARVSTRSATLGLTDTAVLASASAPRGAPMAPQAIASR